MRKERLELVRCALEALPTRDREVLAMRHLEQLEIDAIALVLGISPGTVKARILRALLKLRNVLESPP
jgi:RNA polymerase sigma-70 factor (ECF subfamily)